MTDYEPSLFCLFFFHHLAPGSLPGGFVGVDIFFVISGYLITGQIHDELNGGKFSIKNFYQRRINRIVPALLCVIAASLILGFILLSPTDLLMLTRSAVFSMFGISNIFFWKEYGNYFSANANEAPLLNTWSLGVEEQFYFIWPLFLLVLFRYFARFKLLLIIIIFAIAMAVSEWGARSAASASYYLLPTRFYELMIGGLLALLSSKIIPQKNWHSTLSFFAGFLLLVGSIVWTSKESQFPGISALFPCLGAVLLIWSGLRPIRYHQILTLKPMVGLGLISYSLYLWHWPLIAYFKYYGIEINFYIGLLIFLIAIIFAWLVWKYIEKPFRKSGEIISFANTFLKRFFLPSAVLLTFNALAINGHGFPERFSSEVARLEESGKHKPNELRAGCHVPTSQYTIFPSSTCRLGVKKYKPDAILIGDSFANHFSGMLDVLAQNENLSLMDYTMDGCPPIPNFLNKNSSSYAERCRLRNEATLSYIEKNKFKLVIFASNWPDDAVAGPLLEKAIDRVQSSGANVIIVLPNAKIEKANICPVRNVMYQRNKECNSSVVPWPSYLNDIKEKFPQVKVINPNKIICPSNICNPVVDNVLIYRDSIHLNDIGSRLLGVKMMEDGVNLVSDE